MSNKNDYKFKFSVVIPVYNVEKYLKACLESISAQTYTHFECFLVNDGSTDKSADICNRFCEKDSRFRLLHQKKTGVSAARNMGLDAAKGDFILFVDSDDCLSPDALQTAWRELTSGPFDWMMFDYIKAKLPDASMPDFSRMSPL